MNENDLLMRADVKNYSFVHNIQIGVDATDHIIFLCKNCKSTLKVIKVVTEKNIQTSVQLVCHKCRLVGQRKFYWNGDGGKYCIFRTQRVRKKDFLKETTKETK